MKDFLEQEFTVGDKIVYPSRQASNMWMNLAEVDDRALANARYGSTFVGGGGVQLTNGRFEKPYNSSASKLIVTLLEPVARGDLTGDGRVDAAVLLGVVARAVYRHIGDQI